MSQICVNNIAILIIICYPNVTGGIYVRSKKYC